VPAFSAEPAGSQSARFLSNSQLFPTYTVSCGQRQIIPDTSVSRNGKTAPLSGGEARRSLSRQPQAVGRDKSAFRRRASETSIPVARLPVADRDIAAPVLAAQVSDRSPGFVFMADGKRKPAPHRNETAALQASQEPSVIDYEPVEGVWRWRRQASEQYLTSCQSFCHFFRQANGRWQTAQIFVGKSCLAIRLPIKDCPHAWTRYAPEPVGGEPTASPDPSCPSWSRHTACACCD